MKKGLLIPLGEPGTVPERLKRVGLRVTEFAGETPVMMVDFGSKAGKLGLAAGQKITRVEIAADRPDKEWMFIPAPLLLLGVVFLQVSRQRRELAARPMAAAL